MMTAMHTSENNRFNRCSNVVACACARICPNADTAVYLVVSLCVLCLRVIMPAT